MLDPFQAHQQDVLLINNDKGKEFETLKLKSCFKIQKNKNTKWEQIKYQALKPLLDAY